MGNYDWRLADTNVWKVERMLLDYPHRRDPVVGRRVDALRARYRAFRARFPGRKPVFYRGRDAGRRCRRNFARLITPMSIGFRPREQSSSSRIIVVIRRRLRRWWRENEWRRRCRERDDE